MHQAYCMTILIHSNPGFSTLMLADSVLVIMQFSFFLSCAIHTCSCNGNRWIQILEGQLPSSTIRTLKDNCRVRRGMQQRWKEPKRVGPALRWWWFEWPEGEAANLIVPMCCLFLYMGGNLSDNRKAMTKLSHAPWTLIWSHKL